MDDFENKDLQSPENEAAGSAAQPAEGAKSPTQVEDDLVKELEGIRSLLQNELDSEKEETATVRSAEVISDNGELIQELDEIEETAEDEEGEKKEKRICECCGENECDDSYGEDYPYCAECRRLMTASPAHFGGIVMFVVMLVVAGVSLYFCAGSVDDYTSLMTAQTAYSEKRLIDAASSYSSYIQSKTADDDVSLKAVRNLIDIFSTMGYYNDAANLVTTYGETHPSIMKNEKFAKIPEIYASFLATSSAVNSAIGDVVNSDKKFDYDKKAAELDKLLKEGKDKEGTPYSTVFIEYYKFVLMSLAELDESKQIEQLLKVKELDKGENKWIYLPNFVNVYARMGDAQNAGLYFEECMSLNIQESDLYMVYANAYRFGEKIDADKILAIADRAKESWPSSAAPGYQQIYAIGYLLKGDGESAMKAIEEFVGNGNYTVSACNLYALCSLYVKDNEGYEKMVDLFKSSGSSIGSTIVKYKNGKMTLEQVLTDKGGDI